MNEKNVQEALGFLGDDLIEKGEFDMMQRKKHSRVRRGVLIAAVLAGGPLGEKGGGGVARKIGTFYNPQNTHHTQNGTEMFRFFTETNGTKLNYLTSK